MFMVVMFVPVSKHHSMRTWLFHRFIPRKKASVGLEAGWTSEPVIQSVATHFANVDAPALIMIYECLCKLTP